MAPLAAVKVAVTVALLMVCVCMIFGVVAIPAVVIAPVPAIVSYRLTSMLLAMVPLVFSSMTNIAVVTIVAPIVAPKNTIVSGDRSTDFGDKTWVLMFRVRRQRCCPGERQHNANLD